MREVRRQRRVTSTEVADNPGTMSAADDNSSPVTLSMPGISGDDSGRDLIGRAFSRAAGAAPSYGNDVKLLLDSRENYPAWLAAIAGARHRILFESYMVESDEIGHEFAEALMQKARDGVRVCVLYDWLGSGGSRSFWGDLRNAGIEVLCFNPPRIESPLGWLSRDHRKMIAIDGTIGFVSGLCISKQWVGDPARRLEPWRDTGVVIYGPAVVDLERAFMPLWHAAGGSPLEVSVIDPAMLAHVPHGQMRVRVIANAPSSAGTYRVDLLIASVAKKHLWLTDAYFVATAAYTQALRAAASDGVDVRLLVPGASDIPAISPLSRSGYRALLEAGVRVFEWNGTMLHAKCAVADGLWSRIGSTNLNFASWMSNYELDVAVEDRAFAELMAAQYERDLTHATEIVLTPRNRVRRTRTRRQIGIESGVPVARRAISGSAGRAAAGAVSVGSALGAALTNRRQLGPAEAGLLAKMAALVLALAAVAIVWPRILAWPLAVFAAWLGIAWAVKAFVIWRRADPQKAPPEVGERPDAENPGEPGAKE